MDQFRDKVEWATVPRLQADIIDKVVSLTSNNLGYVETENDWKAILLLFELFKIEHPSHFIDFNKNMAQYKKLTADTHAIIKDDNGDMVQHMFEIPEIFYTYVITTFPLQKWDKDFCRKLAKELPILKVTENF